jgi:hypothetical protein
MVAKTTFPSRLAANVADIFFLAFFCLYLRDLRRIRCLREALARDFVAVLEIAAERFQ